MAAKGKTGEPGDETSVTIKKYANRRLYNTATSSYVTLEHLAEMVREGVEFVVYDAKSGEDITRSVLTQIIVEAEAKGQSLLPISFLRHLISFYGDSLQALVPRYLEQSMGSFARNQEEMRAYMRQAMGGLFPFGPLEEIGKQNMALFEKTMSMFTPFVPTNDGEEGGAAMPSRDETIDTLQRQLRAMQQQLDALKPQTGGGGQKSGGKQGGEDDKGGGKSG
ncbi:MAG: polyhydroxyalkanoate synthesis repressor PhaR [Acetobacterales bacterium]